LLDAFHLQFLFTHVTFSLNDVVRRLPMYTSYKSFLCEYICNLVTMVGLTNDESCLIHSLHVEKHWGSERIMKVFSSK